MVSSTQKRRGVLSRWARKHGPNQIYHLSSKIEKKQTAAFTILVQSSKNATPAEIIITNYSPINERAIAQEFLQSGQVGVGGHIRKTGRHFVYECL